jgi:uncharacterized membrane protein
MINHLGAHANGTSSVMAGPNRLPLRFSATRRRVPPIPSPAGDSSYLDRGLFFVVLTVLAFILSLLTVSLTFQHANYAAGIHEIALGKRPLDHAAVLAYSRAWDFAVVKTSSIFLAFTLILLGTLYVLRAGSIAFRLDVSGATHRSSLETGSPGLVMITLGVVLMMFVTFHKDELEYGNMPIPTVRRAGAEQIAPMTELPVLGERK